MAPRKRSTGDWPDTGEFEQRLGYVFQDKQLLDRALTHVSANKQGAPRSASYQRLEFLGDRVLGLAIAELLFVTFPRAPEGEMSRRLADLVRKETCAAVASEWEVGPFLRLGESEASTGGSRNTAILGDVCEAIIGGVFLDSGYDAARVLVERNWMERLKKPVRPLRDPKTSLQEWAQGRGLSAPTYKEVRRSGPAHAPVFTIAVQVDGFEDENAQGASKRAAEQAAARSFMQRQGIGEGARRTETEQDGPRA
ncbi:MAG: ribonuclease III [Hyphomicrobiales bacterium]|nr:ribonuclease III [Hyphomicrobiales bacterium]